MAKRRPNPDQLDIFSLPAPVAASAPSAIPSGQRWENYVAYVGDVCRGRRAPGDDVLRVLGLCRVEPVEVSA